MSTDEAPAAAEEERGLYPLPAFEHQIAGHQGLSQEGGSILVLAPGKIAKPVGRGYFAGEDQFYRQLATDSKIAQFCPAYYGTRTFAGRDFVILEDLTYGIHQPCVVDIKVGTCTVAPDATWGKRITHLIKDRATTTRSLGLRLIGAQMAGGRAADGSPIRMCKPWGRSLKASEMAGALRTCFSFEGQLCADVVSEFVGTLKRLLQALQDEPRWQLVSSSLLFVYQPPCSRPDSPSASPPSEAPSTPEARHLRVIDFAHAYPLRCARDSGYLFGLRNLIHLMQSLLDEHTSPTPPAQEPPAHERPSGSPPAQRQRVWCHPSPEDQPCPSPLPPLPRPDPRASSVPLHIDEFHEGIAHSRIGRWCREWVGFERGIPQGAAGEGLGTHKCVVLGPARHAAGAVRQMVVWIRARDGAAEQRCVYSRRDDAARGGAVPLLSVCVSAEANGAREATPVDPLAKESLAPHLAVFFAGVAEERRVALEAALVEELAELLSTLREGSTFQFEGSSLSLAFDAAHADGAAPARVAVWLDDFERPCMTRDADFDASYLATLEALHAAFAACCQRSE
mmetsp:Transcript_16701/g.39880  ORF Transcript_16701/g.39880 Transcript_16701/m.39880 type:complete len:566 (+) Transcript_16701:51-1748(+)